MKRILSTLFLAVSGILFAETEFKDVQFNKTRMKEAKTKFFKVVVNPLGGRLQNLIYKPAGIQMTDPARGSSTENVWNIGKSRFFLQEKPFSLTAEDKGKTFTVTASGNHAGGGINFLKVEKTYSFPADAAKIDILYRFENIPAAMSALPYGFWIHHMLGVYGAKCTYYFPTETGIAAFPPGKQENETWQFRPARGWVGMVSEDGKGLALTMSFPELKCHYAWFSGMRVPSIEWRLETMNIDAGKSYKTKVEVLPFSGLHKISGAGNGLVGEIACKTAAEGDDKVPVIIKVHNAASGKVEAELFIRVAPNGKWQSVKKDVLNFDKPAEIRSFQAEVTAAEDTLLELEVVLRKNGKEAARLNEAVNFDECEEQWTLTPAAPKMTAAANNVDLLRFNHVVESAHIPWMKPLPGGKLRVLALLDRCNIPEVAALSQRLDMEFTAPFFNAASTAVQWNLGDYFGMLSQNDLVNNLEKALKKQYDVILIGGMPWNYFSQKHKAAILSMVRAGTGLVYIGARDFGKDFPLLIKKQNGTITTEPSAVLKDSPVIAGVPLDLLGKEPVWMYEIPNGRIHAAAAGLPYVAETAFGKGKVFFLNYRANFGRFSGSCGLTPNLKNEYADRGVPYEFYFLMIGKAVLAGANRSSALELFPVFGTDEVLFNVKSAGTADTEWELFTLDRFLQKRDTLTTEKKIASGTNQIKFGIPLRKAEGKQILCAIVRNKKGAVLASGAWSFTTYSPVRIAEFSVPVKFAEEGQQVTCALKLDGSYKNAALTLELEDSYGRIVDTKELPAAERVQETLTIRNELPSRFYRVKAVLRADNEVVDCRYANLTVRPADKTMVWDDYEVGTWMTSDGSRFYLWNDQAKIMHTAGFRTLIANWTPLSHDFAIRYNFNPTALHHMGLGRTPEPPEYAKTGNKFLLIRKICLSNPAFLAKTEKEFSDLGKHNRKYGLRFCWMGDEQSITGYGGTPIDFCFSKYCLAEFRKFLKQRYGTLEKLNSEWKTSFASWDAVVPFTKEEVQGKFPQHVAGWADHLEFMDGRLENAALHFFSAFKKNDPAARTSISGTQAPTAYGGMDWYRQMKFFDGLMNYNIGGQMEIQRSFRPDGEFMPWEFGYAGHSSSARIYRTLFLGQKGIMGFAYPSLINPDWTFSEGMKTVLPDFENIDFGIGKYYLNLLKDTTKVAVLYSQASLRAAFFEKRNPLKGETFTKYNALLRNCGIAFNYVATEQVEQGILQNYTHLILPDSAALSDKEMEAILAFAKRGGRIWAEGIPGYRNFNCTLRKNNPLPIICNQPGNKLLEKLSLAYLEQMEYPDKAENYAAMHKLQQELREFIGSKLLKATCDSKEITDLEVYARTGKNDLQSFGIITMNPKAREIRFQFPVSGHIYDALTGSYLGKGDTVTRTLSRMHSALFLVAPERFDKPIVKVSGMTLDIQNKSGNDTVYRIEVISPAGKKLDCYTQKLITKNGKGQYHIPFALSDAKGDYTVKVIEVISRQHVLAKITL